MIPIGIVGVFFKDTVEQIFGSGLLVVGCMLLLTAALLAFSYYAKPRQKESISMKDALLSVWLRLARDAGFVTFRINDRYRFVIGK